jgi:hypothetical protein
MTVTCFPCRSSANSFASSSAVQGLLNDGRRLGMVLHTVNLDDLAHIDFQGTRHTLRAN